MRRIPSLSPSSGERHAAKARALAFAAGVALAPPAIAQSAETIRALAAGASDLSFPAEAKTLRFYSTLSNAIFKPEGSGPFPAIVHFHTCGGINPYRGRYWTEAALERGFVVLVIDTLGPRGLSTLCDTRPIDSKAGVNIYRGVKDAMDAKAHLEKLPFVDPNRIAIVGFSWGAMAGLLAASRTFSEGFTDRPFAAVASFYPGCGQFFFRKDVFRPVLVLMGEDDNEVNVANCMAWLRDLEAAGAPVESRMYRGATHSWDTDRVIDKLAYGGKPVRYVPNPQVTRESTRDLFDFLEKHLGK